MGHRAGHAFLLQCGLKAAPDFRILILIIDQRPTLLYRDEHPIVVALGCDGKTGWMDSAAKPNCQVPRGAVASIEVLVEPTSGRTIDPSLSPTQLHHLVAMSVLVGSQPKVLGPKEDIPLRLQTDQGRPRPMVMGFMIAPCRPLRNMPDQAVRGNFKLGNQDRSPFFLCTL